MLVVLLATGKTAPCREETAVTLSMLEEAPAPLEAIMLLTLELTVILARWSLVLGLKLRYKGPRTLQLLLMCARLLLLRLQFSRTLSCLSSGMTPVTSRVYSERTDPL